MLKLEPKWVEKEFQWTSCLDDAIATLSNFYGLEYRFSYAKAWDFKYTSYDLDQDMLFRQRLNTENALERYHFLEKCHRIKMNYHYCDQVEELLSIIGNELAWNRPCAIKLDSYNIPWDYGYQKLHTNHVCMPVEIGKDHIIVIDPYNHMVNLSFPISGLKEASGFCITFDVDVEHNEAFDCRAILIHVMEELLGISGDCNDFDYMRLFSRDILEHFSEEKEFKETGGGFSWSEFFFRLTEFAFGRSFARQALLYSAQRLQSEEIGELANNLRRMISKFNYAIAILRGGFKGENLGAGGLSANKKEVLKEISSMFYSEAEFEESVANQILNVLQEKGVKGKEDKMGKKLCSGPLNVKSSGIASNVDLSSYFNNKALGEDKEEERADFTGVGEFFLESDFPADRLLVHNGVKFQIGFNRDNLYDNITCQQQKIVIQRKKVIQIDFLLAAEWGSYCDAMKFVFDNGKSEEVSFGSTDFAYDPKYGETVVYVGRTLIKNNHQVMPRQKEAKLFAISVNGLKQNIDYIVLPKCDKIHIFALRILQADE